MRKPFLALLTALAAGTLSPLALAQTASPWPTSKPISVVVPFAAGGAVDYAARMVVTKLGERLGQAVVVDNVAGAGGIVGTTKVARATPDGYTLLVAPDSTIVIAPLVTPDAVKYDPLKDLVPVGLINITPLILTASPSLPVNNFAELVRYARANPGKLNYASPGAGNLLHVAMEALRQQAGINMVHVPYKATPQMVSDLIGGQVDLALLVPSTGLPQIKSGKLKALGVTVDERLTAAPEITPLSDSPELKGYFVTTSIGLFVPARTPQAIIDRLNRELNAILASPEVRKPFEDQAATVGKGSGSDYAEFLRKELARNAVVVKAANIKGE
ncbi:MAG: tripartite tricarboxylate transporter substrate binding protein [Ramlibacter sp.]|uniref:Bug family tripartite tricarboxylate transporter substrate binding protein n=1 Tax=Ramlibacter sp. TaxID=1917967 RepID=UPI00261C7C67|nr:tripartite tricarboxylate transporter substrate binding protein [Ramlibacter sp.]MDH4377394.1 tripartite tricarboxylate transporter substrate binding protein [Ramlibacter sp.]